MTLPPMVWLGTTPIINLPAFVPVAVEIRAAGGPVMKGVEVTGGATPLR